MWMIKWSASNLSSQHSQWWTPMHVRVKFSTQSATVVFSSICFVSLEVFQHKFYSELKDTLYCVVFRSTFPSVFFFCGSFVIVAISRSVSGSHHSLASSIERLLQKPPFFGFSFHCTFGRIHDVTIIQKNHEHVALFSSFPSNVQV